MLQQVCLQIALPPATCCRCSLLQLLWTLLFQSGSALPCSYCLRILACQKESKTHPSKAKHNACKLKKVMVSINHSPFRRNRRENESRLHPTIPICDARNSSVVPKCTSRVGSEEGFFYLCSFKDDATYFSIICRSLKYPVDGISTLRLTLEATELSINTE